MNSNHMFKYYNKILLSLYYLKSSDPFIGNGIDLNTAPLFKLKRNT